MFRICYNHAKSNVYDFFDTPSCLKASEITCRHMISCSIGIQYVGSIFVSCIKLKVRKLQLLDLHQIFKKKITLSPFTKTKVKRAAQVLSNTVHEAILTYICSNDLPSEAFHTALLWNRYIHYFIYLVAASSSILCLQMWP